MKNKKLATINGVVGLVGGILLLIGPFLVLGSLASGSTLKAGTSSATTTSSLLFLLGIVILILGIVGLVHYKGDERVGNAGGVLFIVGGALSIIPFLGWIGGICAIIGGSLYLAKLKNFKTTE